MSDTDPLIGRLAPSPTGAQHLGNARTYLLAWLSIRSRGGRLILRMEDIDSPRVKQGAAEQAIVDLRWLGLDWDEGPDIGGAHEPYVQTLRLEYYYQALEILKSQEMVYPCTCSRHDIEQAASAPQIASVESIDASDPLRHLASEGAVYPGTCSHFRVADAESIPSEQFSWRFRFPRSIQSFQDSFIGNIRLDAATVLGDFLVSARGQVPAYQLAVVVDDYRMGITEVLRGDDLVPSTFRQLALYETLGWRAPQFAHTPLVVGQDGRRLAKRHGDTRLSTLRKSGMRPEQIVGFLAYRSGLTSTAAPLLPCNLFGDLDLSKVPRTPLVVSDGDI